MLAVLGGHPTADDVVRSLRNHGLSVARASVLNVLEDLAAVGLVTSASPGPGAARYEVAYERHDHFVCRVCGSIRDVPRTIEVEGVGLTTEAGLVETAHLVYRRTCADCLAEDAP